MAFVTVYNNLSGTLPAATSGFNTAVSLPDSIYEKWALPDPDPYYPYEYSFCLGPGCKCDWAQESGLWVQMYSYTNGWTDLDSLNSLQDPTRTSWPFGRPHGSSYTDGDDFSRSSYSQWLFNQTVEFRIINKQPPPLFGPFGIVTPGPASLSFIGLTFTIGDQCPAPRVYEPPPPATTYTRFARAIAQPYGWVDIFGDFDDPAPGGGGKASAIII